MEKPKVEKPKTEKPASIQELIPEKQATTEKPASIQELKIAIEKSITINNQLIKDAAKAKLGLSALKGIGQNLKSIEKTLARYA